MDLIVAMHAIYAFANGSGQFRNSIRELAKANGRDFKKNETKNRKKGARPEPEPSYT